MTVSEINLNVEPLNNSSGTGIGSSFKLNRDDIGDNNNERKDHVPLISQMESQIPKNNGNKTWDGFQTFNDIPISPDNEKKEITTY